MTCISKCNDGGRAKWRPVPGEVALTSLDCSHCASSLDQQQYLHQQYEVEASAVPGRSRLSSGIVCWWGVMALGGAVTADVAAMVTAGGRWKMGV